MNSKSLLFLSTLTLFLSFSTPVKAQSKSILNEIVRTGLLKIGIREDAVPFGYRYSNNNLAGVCLDFIYIFKEKLKEKLNKEVILVRLYKSTFLNRFELVNDGIIHLECGPNVIRKIPELNVIFSSPFLSTGTQLLINKKKQNDINLNTSLVRVNIGVLDNTDSQQLIEIKYPAANITKFQGITGSFRGIQALQGEKIDAFAGDSILLIGEVILQELNLGKEYVLVPKIPFNCKEYGLILPDNDSQWQEFVNSVVNSVITDAKLSKIFKKWFSGVIDEIEVIENFCHSQLNQNHE
ncbi:MAG: transporter substrate-binding domain-containing protein [cyanobacterium endosymbiont of Rhopalodia musculus]|uniref:transporter substrate-binding domain-containing protein n=1 Tax=cyanobacterium endosymbiont of Epithemia clementina EcSB TaxID=3034674 RepID=UPI00247FCBFA|nr:transporter substrate-binding domain-containing protein [cyanobacterium endosymbiont of Epithemia clementina EcSB]WGT66799.1 transporter substrate-binding domain-containing protein [cyanobacterium endosymbiont of Epithemia clementina EcSB]